MPIDAGSRSARIRVLVAEQAARRGGRVGVIDVCSAAVVALPVHGAAVSAMSRTTAGHPLCGTDEVSVRLEELQLTLGEGPCLDAFARGTAVPVGDLSADAVHARWPLFAPAAAQAGAGAVFAFPLRVGTISPGVLDLYSRTPCDLDDNQLADAILLADTATLVLLETPVGRPGSSIHPVEGGPADSRFANPGGYRAEIDQATGMLTEQLGVGIEEAFVRLRAHAYAHDRRLADVAADVVARRLRLARDPRQQPSDDT